MLTLKKIFFEFKLHIVSHNFSPALGGRGRWNSATIEYKLSARWWWRRQPPLFCALGRQRQADASSWTVKSTVTLPQNTKGGEQKPKQKPNQTKTTPPETPKQQQQPPTKNKTENLQNCL